MKTLLTVIVVALITLAGFNIYMVKMVVNNTYELKGIQSVIGVSILPPE